MELDQEKNKILVMGVGNLLMGDEGIGVQAIQHMQDMEFPENVRLLDGGTGGFHILSEFQGYETIIMIDATFDEHAAGHIKVIEPRFSSDFPKSLSSHDIGLKDLVESASLLGKLPKIFLITVSVKYFREVKMELTDEVKAVLPEVAGKVKEILDGL